MKLGHALAAAALLGLAACGQNDASKGAAAPPAASPLDSVFPDLTQASFRGVFNLRRAGREETQPVTMIRSGANLRMEMMAAQGPATVISNADANEAYVISERGGQRFALQVAMDNEMLGDALAAWREGRGATRVGACSAAGLSGTEWAIAPTETNSAPRTACVTSDGIVLRAAEDGATTWEATSVQRGPQDPALFQIPAGVQVIRLGDMAARMRAAMEKMKAQ